MRGHLLEQDLVYVGGGSVICLMGVLRAHGLDVALREAWEAGVVLCGLSAGSLCWFAEAMTGYHGASRPVQGLGLDPGVQRRALRQGAAPPARLPRRGRPAGCRAATRRRTARRCTSSASRSRAWSSSRPAARAYRVDAVGGEVVELAAERWTTWAPTAAVEPALAA